MPGLGARLAEWGAQVMAISVIAGDEGAMRFYQREGASGYLRTLIMPAGDPAPGHRMRLLSPGKHRP